jgi:membrane protease YdiL (CAAX protease family)
MLPPLPTTESAERRRTAGWVVLAYGSLGALGAMLALALGGDPLAVAAWMGLGGVTSAIVSIALGAFVAVITIALTRALVPRAGWARELHGNLRPVVHGADDATLLLMAVASGVGEELFFRGLLTPLVGVWLSSAAFGLLHQMRGKARWAWALWATIMGLVFATLFKLTGHLAGPIAAHVAINSANLRYLRDTNPAPKSRHLGGLLAR